jgi:hypothetical protein
MRSNPAGSIPRALSPVGYALFAVALGAAAGAVLRRTRAALAVTLGVFLAARMLIAEFARRHRMTAITFIYNLARPRHASRLLLAGRSRQPGSARSDTPNRRRGHRRRAARGRPARYV